MTAMSLEKKIENIYKKCDNFNIDNENININQVKNIEILVSQMIKHHYEWEEIVSIVSIIRKGRAQELINIIKDIIITIS